MDNSAPFVRILRRLEEVKNDLNSYEHNVKGERELHHDQKQRFQEKIGDLEKELSEVVSENQSLKDKVAIFDQMQQILHCTKRGYLLLDPNQVVLFANRSIDHLLHQNLKGIRFPSNDAFNFGDGKPSSSKQFLETMMDLSRKGIDLYHWQPTLVGKLGRQNQVYMNIIKNPKSEHSVVQIEEISALERLKTKIYSKGVLLVHRCYGDVEILSPQSYIGILNGLPKNSSLYFDITHAHSISEEGIGNIQETQKAIDPKELLITGYHEKKSKSNLYGPLRTLKDVKTEYRSVDILLGIETATKNIKSQEEEGNP